MPLLIAVISTIVCFLAGSVLVSPNVRENYPSLFLGVYFFFEGFWTMINHIISGIWPSNGVMDIIHYCGAIVVGACVILSVLSFSRKQSSYKSDIKTAKRKREN